MTQGPPNAAGPQDPQHPHGQPGPGQQQPGQVPPPPGGQAPPPPPPPGGYGGQAPPPPPPPGGGQPSSSESPAIDAVKHGWELFTKNVANFIIGALLWGLAFVLFYAVVVGLILVPLFVGDSEALFVLAGGLGFFGTLVSTFLVFVLGMFAQAGFLNAALVAHDTGSVSIGDFFKFRNVAHVALFGLVIGVVNGILGLTFILPLIITALTIFSMPLIIDRNESFFDAIMNSAKLFTANFAQSALLVVLMWVISAIGAAICGVGLLVAVPVSMLALATYFRTLGQTPSEFKFG